MKDQEEQELAEGGEVAWTAIPEEVDASVRKHIETTYPFARGQRRESLEAHGVYKLLGFGGSERFEYGQDGEATLKPEAALALAWRELSVYGYTDPALGNTTAR